MTESIIYLSIALMISSTACVLLLLGWAKDMRTIKKQDIAIRVYGDAAKACRHGCKISKIDVSVYSLTDSILYPNDVVKKLKDKNVFADQ